MRKTYFIISFLCLCRLAQAQMTIQTGATLYIETGAKVTLQGDLTSSESIQGPGSIVMKGSSLQNITMNGLIIPNLEIDNTANVSLSGSSAKIGSSLLLTNGKLLTSTQDLILTSTATITGNNSNNFIWTNGAGQVKKELTADINSYEIPVGENTNYRPVYLTSTGASYAGASIGVRCVSGATTNRPPMIANYLTAYWPLTKTGITGGTQTVSAQYIDPADVSGTEGNLAGYFYDGTDWSSVGETHDNSANKISAMLTSGSGELTGMNKFITVGTRAFLQGAYNSTTGLMNDGLRSGGNVIPVNDPYRSAPYNTSFTHVANANPELVAASVFNDQASANDNIVDWVFLELRNTASSPGNAVLQTRSALIQRDGDIVDVDGVSPVTFNNISNGSYVLSVRHRNHLGLSSDNMSAINWRTFTETKSNSFTANLLDLRTVAPGLLYNSGAGSFTTATHPSLSTVNLLWAGNVNGNAATSYQGPGNDRAVLLSDLGGNQLTTLSGYYRSDLNLNKTVSYQGPGNDRSFLLTVLASNELVIRTQSLPQ